MNRATDKTKKRGQKASKKATGKAGKQGRKAAWRSKGTGSIEKHGRVYRAVWSVNGKVFRRSTGTGDKDEAEKILGEFVAPYRLKMEARKDAAAAKTAKREGLDAATALVLSASANAKRTEAGRLSVPLSKGWETFNSSLSRRPLSKGTARMYEARWNTFSKWIQKNRPKVVGLADVDEEAASAFMAEIKSSLSPKSFNDRRALLLMVWRTLDREAGLDGFNPWQGIKALDRETHNRRELTVEELARVVGPLEGEMRVLFAIGIYTGLRLGDCVNLSWGAVDLVRGFIQWTPHKTKKHGTVVRIPLFPALASILAETPARKRRGLILPELAEEYVRHTSYTSERVAKVFRDAGIVTQGDTGRANPKHTQTTRKAIEVGVHSLRHTVVSLCANAGVPLHIVQAIVGHTNEAMTQHYFHVSDDALRGAVAVLPDVFRAPSALPAHKTGEKPEVPEAVKAAEAFEMVPASVAKVARLLDGCSPAVLAHAERQIEALVASDEDGMDTAAAITGNESVVRALHSIVDALSEMSSSNWRKQRERALALIATMKNQNGDPK